MRYRSLTAPKAIMANAWSSRLLVAVCLLAAATFAVKLWDCQNADYTSLKSLSNRKRSQQHHTAAVVPDLSNHTADVLPDVAKAVAQLEQQGMGKKIIAMSLYGANPRYTRGAVENALLAKRDWPGWTYRVYHGAGVPAEVLTAIKEHGGELVNMTGKGSQSKIACMFWRFTALTDPTATRFISRDADARLTPRDKAAVNEWVDSGLLFHIMHDHPEHAGTPILGGMFGAVNGLLHPRLIHQWFEHDRDIARKSGSEENLTYKWFNDQEWLKHVVWPLVASNALSHSSFYCNEFGEAKSLAYPVQRESLFDFVGNAYRPENQFQGGAVPDEPCPAKCRRKPDWLRC